VIGTSAAEEAFQFDDRPEDAPPLAVLDRPQSALIDDKSKRAQFGFALDAVADDQPVRAELSGSRIDIIGSFSLGTDFASDGTLLLSAANLANYFPWRNAGGEPLGAVDLGFVKLAPDADGEATVARIRDVMADEVTVLTKAAYRQREVDFWKANTPVGMIFQIGTWMGFVVGVIICYQVLYTDIADHLKEYATLKAMGYRPGYFVRLVLAESVILSVMGFIPGVVLSWILYTWLGVSTGLLMNLTVSRAGIVLALTIAMCIVSGVFALKKLLRADPAALF
jgi:putative ABC transport system permease protein